jgi:hypothetical protein
MAERMKIKFKASDGGLRRFSERQSMSNRLAFREAVSAPTDDSELFKKNCLEWGQRVTSLWDFGGC